MLLYVKQTLHGLFGSGMGLGLCVRPKQCILNAQLFDQRFLDCMRREKGSSVAWRAFNLV